LKAAIFEGNGKLTVKEVEEPELEDRKLPKKWKKGEYLFIPEEKQVKIKVTLAGICGTDIHILDIPPRHDAEIGTILGHEYIGKVVEVGKAVQRFKPGQKVVINPNISCGECYYCRNGMPNICRDMSTLGIFCDGGFAEYAIVPSKQLIHLPQGIRPRQAIFFEPLSCADHAWRLLSPLPGNSILIYGAGCLGCLFIGLARLSGAGEIIVSEPSKFRRKIARALGAKVTVPRDVRRVVEREVKWGIDIAIDACGIPEVINEAIGLVKPGGKITTFGEQNVRAFAKRVSFTEITNKELKIIGSYAAVRSFDESIALLKQMKLERLVTHEVPLRKIERGIELMRRGNTIKVLVRP
jgi:threonine dehydrogenase-like Zn-dependent dehydrogenase